GLVGDRQGLHPKLLLGLQRRQSSAFLGQVGVDQVAHAGFQSVLHLAGEGQLTVEGFRLGAEIRQGAGEAVDRRFNVRYRILTGLGREGGVRRPSAVGWSGRPPKSEARRRGGGSAGLQGQGRRRPGARGNLDVRGRRLEE